MNTYYIVPCGIFVRFQKPQLVVVKFIFSFLQNYWKAGKIYKKKTNSIG